jgi:hypothetical protein
VIRLIVIPRNRCYSHLEWVYYEFRSALERHCGSAQYPEMLLYSCQRSDQHILEDEGNTDVDVLRTMRTHVAARILCFCELHWLSCEMAVEKEVETEMEMETPKIH